MPQTNANQQHSHCELCIRQEPLAFEFTMAFQPIINLNTQEIFRYEALVRGLKNEPAFSIISQVNEDNRYTFDQQCRVKAIRLASRLGLDCVNEHCKLSINFLPGAIYVPERCIKTTLAAANEYAFPIHNIMFEFTETERFKDNSHIKRIVEAYRKLGFQTAIDDFGAGYSGLSLLTDFQPNIVKLDMGLIRDINEDKKRRIIVKNCINMLDELGVVALAEGIETAEERDILFDLGVNLMQGYLFAKPEFECLPEPVF